MALPLPAPLRRLAANRRLLAGCMPWGTPTQWAIEALADGADPNLQRFSRRWRWPVGIRFGVKQWWGGRRDEIHYGREYENYWITPLGCAVHGGNTTLLGALLEAGANPWAPGNGPQGGPRPSPMHGIFCSHEPRPGLIATLEGYMDHLVASYFDTAPSRWNDLTRFRRATLDSPVAQHILDVLESRLSQQGLEKALPPATGCVESNAPSRPTRPRM